MGAAGPPADAPAVLRDDRRHGLAVPRHPKGFFPTEDIGQLSVTTEARQDISFPAMVELQGQAAEIIRSDPAVDTVISSVGSRRSNQRA